MRVGLWRRLSAEKLMLLNFCWRRLLRVPWTARKANQSILKEISPGIALEGMMLKLKLQYFGHLMRRIDSLEKILMLGGIGGRRRRGRQRMRWLDGIIDSMDMSLSEHREAWRAAIHGVAKSQTRLSDWTELKLSVWRRKWQPTPISAWRTPLTEELGGLHSMGLQRVGHNWSNLTRTQTFCNCDPEAFLKPIWQMNSLL